MKVMMGIPAHDEENNIDKLLKFLVSNCMHDVDSIYVISSGSKDRTNEIVEHYSKNFSKINLLVEEERNGKASALNNLLDVLEYDYEALVCLGADNIPQEGSVNSLIECLKQDGAAIVGGRPVPVNDEKKLMGFFAHLLWNLHHLISLKSPKISGELMAFKKGVVREIPPTVINDDLYVQTMFELQNHDLRYCSDATVYLKGPETIGDFIKQRRRVFVGHKQAESLLGKSAPTMKWPKLSLIWKACPYNGLKGGLYAVLFVFFQGLAYSLALLDFYRGKLPYKWDIVKTSKNLD